MQEEDNSEKIRVALDKLNAVVSDQLPAIQDFVNRKISANAINPNITFNEETVAAFEALKPVIDASTELFDLYGIPESQLYGELECDPEDVALAGVIMLDLEKNIGIVNMDAPTFSESMECAAAAIGINVFDIFHEFKDKAGDALCRFVLKNVAKRLVGPVGVAIMVAEYSICIAAVW